MFDGFSEPMYNKDFGILQRSVISMMEYDLPMDDLPSNKNGMSYLISCLTSVIVSAPEKNFSSAITDKIQESGI